MSNEFEGIGVSVEQERARPARARRSSSARPAERAGHPPGRRDHRRQRRLRSPARRPRWPRRRSRASPARRCALHDARAATAASARCGQAREDRGARRDGRAASRARACKLGVVELIKFTPGVHGELRDGRRPAAECRAPRAWCSTCAATRGGLLDEAVLVVEPVRGGRPDRLARVGARARAASSTAKGDAIRARRPAGRAGGRRQRERVGDRHRRAAGPRPRHGRGRADLRQGRVPGDRRRSPTAARSRSPPAPTTCQTARTWPARDPPAGARPATTRARERDEALPVALDALRAASA